MYMALIGLEHIIITIKPLGILYIINELVYLSVRKDL